MASEDDDLEPVFPILPVPRRRKRKVLTNDEWLQKQERVQQQRQQKLFLAVQTLDRHPFAPYTVSLNAPTRLNEFSSDVFGRILRYCDPPALASLALTSTLFLQRVHVEAPRYCIHIRRSAVSLERKRRIFATLSRFTHLCELTIVAPEIPEFCPPVELFQPSAHCLQRLTLPRIGDNGVILPLLPALRYLYITHCSYNDLTWLPTTAPNLLSLHLNYWLPDQRSCAFLKNFTNLESLHVGHAHLLLADVPPTVRYLCACATDLVPQSAPLVSHHQVAVFFDFDFGFAYAGKHLICDMFPNLLAYHTLFDDVSWDLERLPRSLIVCVSNLMVEENALAETLPNLKAYIRGAPSLVDPLGPTYSQLEMTNMTPCTPLPTLPLLRVLIFDRHNMWMPPNYREPNLQLLIMPPKKVTKAKAVMENAITTAICQLCYPNAEIRLDVKALDRHAMFRLACLRYMPPDVRTILLRDEKGTLL